jgi:glycosyltransferase involved in cell wall biosynthesis
MTHVFHPCRELQDHPLISVIIPAFDSAEELDRCLQALREGDSLPFQTIVVDDHSKDNTCDVALKSGATLLRTARRSGPSIARNLGTKFATGDIFFFLDSDVCVHADTLSKVHRSFAEDPELDALIGSYDMKPASQDFISQYRNLMHAYVHRTGSERASTFWSGCGAIRRAAFLEHNGFDETYGRPAIEDIELGYRLIRGGRKILLDREVLVTHLKQWTFWRLLKTDILDRGIPWTQLILRDQFMPRDLNLQLSQRVSVALAFVLVALSATIAVVEGAYLLIPLFAIVFLMLSRWWGELGVHGRPRRAYIRLLFLIILIVAMAHAVKMNGLIPPLVIGPALLFLKHRYGKNSRVVQIQRWLVILYICLSIGVTLAYLPMHRLMLCLVVVSVALGLLNSSFYVFLAGKRGVPFMLAAIPFHVLYHFYNGISFLAGTARFYWTNLIGTSNTGAPTSIPLTPSKARPTSK